MCPMAYVCENNSAIIVNYVNGFLFDYIPLFTLKQVVFQQKTFLLILAQLSEGGGKSI